ncbi:MAG: fused MFS/spermidine synthase, partial [Chloroflexi bacterium]|nr:fused MFS/spermidine synthase [Chloroflexota bacterium]
PGGEAAPGVRYLVLAVFAVSGFASLALEVIWFRVLVLFLPATTYAFTIMLATVLGGIALGSYLVTPLMRRRLDWLAVLALLELGIGVAALFSLTALAHGYGLAGGGETPRGAPVVGQLRVSLAASVLAMLPATLLLGLAFPIGLRLWASAPGDGQKHAGERIGVFYALNVVGAILGALAAGFVLLPRFGSQVSLAIIAALALASGLALLVPVARTRRALAVGAAGVGVALFGATAAGTPDPFAAALAQRYPGQQLLWHEEGVQTTVTVQQLANGRRVLYLDGLHQADDIPGTLYTHRLIGHLPMALHPDPREVLVIGLGGGATPGAASQYRGAAVDVVELAQSVVHGSEWLRHANYDVLRQPNVRLRVDDGRNYLLLTPKRYDVITADVIQPYHAGAGNLYSVEYFRLARRVLKDDGLMLQWIGELPETQYKLIMRTFLSVFPETTLWFMGHLMVGSTQPLQIDRAAFERKRADPATRVALEQMRAGTFEALLGLYWAGPEELRRYVGAGPLLSDDGPMVEYFLSLPRNEPPRDVSGVRGDVQRHVTR